MFALIQLILNPIKKKDFIIWKLTKYIWKSSMAPVKGAVVFLYLISDLDQDSVFIIRNTIFLKVKCFKRILNSKNWILGMEKIFVFYK